MATSNDALAERLRSLIAERNTSDRALSVRAGLNPTAVRDIMQGRSISPRSDTLQKLAKALDVPLATLLGLDGIAQAGAPPPPTIRKRAGPDDGIEYQGAAYVALPVYDVNASAGPGAINAEHPEPEAWQLLALDLVRTVTRARVSELAIVRVSGDSMANTLQNGDLILVDQSVKRVGRDGLYVLAAGMDVQVKRVSRDWASKTLTISSDNPAYPPSTGVGEDDIAIYGRVVWLSRNLGG
jgi:phage repressor protein C with HTH and peptisase S24 domain